MSARLGERADCSGIVRKMAMDPVQELATDPLISKSITVLSERLQKTGYVPFNYGFCVCGRFATKYGGFSAGSPTGGRHRSAALKEDEQEQ